MLPNPRFELTEEQIQELEAARRLIPKIEEQIRRAKLAGIDVSEQEADLAAQKIALDKLYKAYVRKSSSSVRPT